MLSVTNSASRFELRHILETSNFQQAATMAFACLLVALLSVIGSGCVLESVMRSHVREMILADVRTMHELTQSRSSHQVAELLRQRDLYDRRSERHSLLLDPQGKVLTGDATMLEVMDCISFKCPDNWRNIRTYEDRQIMGLVIELRDGGRYFSAYDLQPMLERTQIIPLMAGAGLFLVLLGSLILSLRYSLRKLYRIERIHDALKRFASGDHQAFPPLDRSGDELDRLATDIYRNLERINKLMAEVKGVTSHIAHELRTPLTRLQNRLVSAAEIATGDVREALWMAADESERIQSLFRAVMRVGEVETGRCAHLFEAFPAHDLLHDLREYYLPLADERNSPLEIETDPGCQIWGDRALLFQAMANLVDNALKYAPRNSTVTLFARHRGHFTILGVADHGSGIPASATEQVVERFHRLHTSGDIPGNGLGLTLVKAISELHGGSLCLSDNQPGLRVELQLGRAIP
ncbi:sensor histidine kinase [Pseudomonas sp. NPDC089734]|uniref:sensor histidine kinase n=1 Tax=Pseudomonas sp. NPDC089734 TaxID=3364469 RepID=UPI00380D4E51